MVSVEATAYMIAEGLATRWKARKAKRSRAAARKAATADPNPNPTPGPSKKPARASGAQVAPAAALEMVTSAAPAGAGADADATKPRAAPAIDVAADVPGGERQLTPRAGGDDVEASALGSQARPAKARAAAVGSKRGWQKSMRLLASAAMQSIETAASAKDLVAEQAVWVRHARTAALCCKFTALDLAHWA